MPIAVFGRPDTPLLLEISALAQWRVVIEQPSRAHEIFSRDWPELEFIEVASTRDGLLALRDGRADYFIHNVFSVEYERRELGLDTLKVALQTPYSFDVRISTMPTQHGESVVMRLLNQSTGILKLDGIGLPPGVLGRLRKVMRRPSGMILVIAPAAETKII